MTAKVAGKWLSQDPIENYKNFDYSRTTRNTGAGYLINVDVYIESVLKESTQVLTRQYLGFSHFTETTTKEDSCFG